MAAAIRRANPADATTVALLGRITFAETFGHLFRHHVGDLRAYLDATFDVAKIEASLGNPHNAYWLAFQDRLPIGYAKLKHASPPPGKPQQSAVQLQKIYVVRDDLGRRIGDDLLGPVVQEASAAQEPLLWLDVLRENDRAIRFYTRHGFVVSGEDTYTIGAQRFVFYIMQTDMP
ncbi:MAG TPA: GNAT family N-acetyltransferase [Acetobacteraceae bacterium]|nr:GNAT family N-acetyltransferase [Acetobacteraceae bacterium]